MSTTTRTGGGSDAMRVKPRCKLKLKNRAPEPVKQRGGEFIRDRVPGWLSYAATQGLTLTGYGRWRSTLCDFHDDKRPSMRVNTESGGWCCMSCGASGGDTLAHYMKRTGKDFIDAAKALGAWREGGGAPARSSFNHQKARALPASDALALVYNDALLVWVAAGNLAHGITLTDADRDDLGAAARRILLAYEGGTA